MQLYEVIRWGNDSDDPLSGGADGPDTCFLVRADSVEQAASLVDDVLAAAKPRNALPHADAVHLLGNELADAHQARILRGPYVQHAYRHGWRCWYRDDSGAPWIQQVDGAGRAGYR